MNNKMFGLIRRSYQASARILKSTAFARSIAVTLFAAAIVSLYGALATSATGLSSSRRTNLGAEDASASLSLTVWLKLRNPDALHAAVKQMYDKSSPNYHHWLTPDQLRSKFAPTAEDAATVRNFLASHNLKVTSTEPHNHFIRAQGRVGDVQNAFNTQINRMMVNGQVHRVTASRPTATGPAKELIAGVQGINDRGYQNDIQLAFNPETGKPYAGVSPNSVHTDGTFFSSDCLRAPETQTFTTNGDFPKATYKGNRYGADITNTNPPDLPPCGYNSAEMQKAYGLDSVYSHGLDGTGQTIVIVDAFGSNTLFDDVNLFSQINGLPTLRMHGPNANFKMFQPNGHARCTATNGCIAGNWQIETTLDVEWAHSIAPNAKIVVVLGADNSFDNLDTANLFAIENHLGNVISNSFGIPEVVLVDEAPSLLDVENQIAEMAAASGISQNVSTGDAGDNLALDTAQFGIPATSPGAIASSPFVTAVGGTSTFLDADQRINLQTGWGLNFVRIADPNPNPPTIPPLFFGFNGGAGGGTSTYFAKPDYQAQLPGKHRKQPDIAMNADPSTGVELIFTPDSIHGHPQTVAVIGGTSLSTPMFAAFWALANQAAAQNGMDSLGQAAPLLYQLSSPAITDVNVTAADTKNNVTGTIFNPPDAPAHLSALFLAEPQEPTKRFVSTLFNSPTSSRWDVFTFGTDSSLSTNPGWDNVTGLGTPNGMSFIDAVVAAAGGPQ